MTGTRWLVPPIALLAAEREELQPYLERVQEEGPLWPVETSAFQGFQGWLWEQPVVLVITGVGKVMAAQASQAVLDQFKPRAIIMVGVAGALQANLRRGDVVVSIDCIQHDLDVTPLGYPRGTVPGTDYRFIPADMNLVALAMQTRLDHNQVIAGRIVSGDQFLSQEETQAKEYLTQELKGSVVDMECAAVALVCTHNRFPFVAIRTVATKGSQEQQYREQNLWCTASPVVQGLFQRFALPTSLAAQHAEQVTLYRLVTELSVHVGALTESVIQPGRNPEYQANVEQRMVALVETLQDLTNATHIRWEDVLEQSSQQTWEDREPPVFDRAFQELFRSTIQAMLKAHEYTEAFACFQVAYEERRHLSGLVECQEEPDLLGLDGFAYALGAALGGYIVHASETPIQRITLDSQNDRVKEMLGCLDTAWENRFLATVDAVCREGFCLEQFSQHLRRANVPVQEPEFLKVHTAAALVNYYKRRGWSTSADPG